MITIYHNSRCGKSREAIKFLGKQNLEFKIVNYLENNLTVNELKEILKKLNIPAIDLVRKKEAIWIESFKGKTLTEEEIILAMVNNPKLIERPIVINGNKAVVARPAENVNDLF
jgi:arsenate reductase (glutaredoxin)